jgi:hypothetical protein
LLAVCLIVVLAAHLWAVNLATAAPLVCMWLQWREYRRQDQVGAELGRQLCRQSLIALVVAMLLGGAALGLVWKVHPGPFFNAARQINASRYWFGLVELVFYLVSLGACLGLWRAWAGALTLRRLALLWLADLLAGTDLGYHFPPLFAMIGAFSTRPETWGQGVKFTAALFDPEVMAFTLHFLLASLAVTGATLMLIAWRRSENGGHENEDAAAALRRWVIWGARLALVPTAMQLVAGVLVLLQLPDGLREGLLGQDMLASALFAGSLVASLMLMQYLLAVALGETGARHVLGSVGLMALVILLMVAAQQRSRQKFYEQRIGKPFENHASAARKHDDPVIGRHFTCDGKDRILKHSMLTQREEWNRSHPVTLGPADDERGNDYLGRFADRQPSQNPAWLRLQLL